MKNLLYKELRLALHPTAVLFLFLSAMVLIPSYPYLISFFYTTLGIFFICLNGRETQDIEFTMTLPVPKSGVVQARFLLVILIELAQVLLTVPFAILRNLIIAQPNDVGLNAGLLLFGYGFLLLGLFNLVFFRLYYKNPDKVGKPFLLGCLAVFLLIGAAETSVHVIPCLRDGLNVPGPGFLGGKLAALGIGILGFALLTFAAYKGSVKAFEKRDL